MATTYQNGRVPASALVTLDSGNGRHVTSRKGQAMWYALRANVQRKYGKTLHISPGMNAYRDYAEQIVGRNSACAQGNCNAAAAPGYSSHGGTWRSAKFTGGVWVDALAFDIGDYAQIGQAAFYAEARAVGFNAGLITPELAGIFEPWHIILFDPWGAAPADLDSEDFDMPLNATSDKQVIKDAIFEVLRDVKLGPGGRNFWDSQQFQADLTAGVDAKVGAQQPALDSQAVKDALIGALTDWRVFDGGRNVFDQLKFIADSGQGPVELSASLEAIAKAVRAEFKTDPLK